MIFHDILRRQKIKVKIAHQDWKIDWRFTSSAVTTAFLNNHVKQQHPLLHHLVLPPILHSMANSMVLCMVLGHSYCFRGCVPFVGISGDRVLPSLFISIFVYSKVLTIFICFRSIPIHQGLCGFSRKDHHLATNRWFGLFEGR